jgi:hypothetical protein
MHGHAPSTALYANRVSIAAKLQEPRFVCHGGVITRGINHCQSADDGVEARDTDIRFSYSPGNRVVYAYALFNVP